MGAGLDRSPAKRAGGVTPKPHVNTRSMEAMVAPRQQTAILALLELHQTHSALHLLLATDGVHEDRQRREESRIQPPIS